MGGRRLAAADAARATLVVSIVWVGAPYRSTGDGEGRRYGGGHSPRWRSDSCATLGNGPRIIAGEGALRTASYVSTRLDADHGDDMNALVDLDSPESKTQTPRSEQHPEVLATGQRRP